MAIAAFAQNASSPIEPLITPAVPPAVEQGAIKLSGKSANPTPEIWEQIIYPPSPGNASPTGSELWVRNVSQPTLEPFLSDPAKATGAAMIVAPGGGFIQLAMDREGYPLAKWLNQRGIAVFVLKYRLAATPVDQKEFEKLSAQITERMKPLFREGRRPRSLNAFLSTEQLDAMVMAREDALEAIRYVRTHAAQYGLSPNRIGMMGFSAGAFTTLNVALNADVASRPDLIAPMYGGIPDDTPVPAKAPPAFFAAATDDGLSAYSVDAYDAWRARGIPAELHLFENGGHGFWHVAPRKKQRSVADAVRSVVARASLSELAAS
jgi:acetyl esterase/lipase